jgi:hypothetical protein
MEPRRGSELAIGKNCCGTDGIVVAGIGDKFFAGRDLPDMLYILTDFAKAERGE